MSTPKPRRDSEALLWTVAEVPIAIEIGWPTLEEINGAVQDGFRRLSRGGVEVGGLLFGRKTDNLVRVLAWRPIACEHARGPAFLLSNEDRQTLMQQIEAADQDPRLQVLEPVGWFVSHTRTGVGMSTEDQSIFEQFFPETWQITLIVHPNRGAPARAGFFVRERDGRVRHEASYREFTIEGVRLAEPPAPAATPSEPVREDKPRSKSHETPMPLPAAVQPVTETGSRWRWVLSAAAALLVCAVALTALPMMRSTEPVVPEPVELRLQDMKGQLRIDWNKGSATVRSAETGRLMITDGQQLAPIDLDRETLQKGSVMYSRMSEDITVKMEIRRAKMGAYQELARYVGPPIPKAPTREVRESRERREELITETSRLRARIDEESDRRRELEKSVKKLEALLERETRRAR